MLAQEQEPVPKPFYEERTFDDDPQIWFRTTPGGAFTKKVKTDKKGKPLTVKFGASKTPTDRLINTIQAELGLPTRFDTLKAIGMCGGMLSRINNNYARLTEKAILKIYHVTTLSIEDIYRIAEIPLPNVKPKALEPDLKSADLDKMSSLSTVS